MEKRGTIEKRYSVNGMLDLQFYDRTIIHENEERMIPDIEVKMML